MRGVLLLCGALAQHACVDPAPPPCAAHPAVRIFDLRTSELVGTTQYIRSRLVGMAAEPGGAPHQLVLGYPTAQLAFLDCRLLR